MIRSAMIQAWERLYLLAGSVSTRLESGIEQAVTRHHWQLATNYIRVYGKLETLFDENKEHLSDVSVLAIFDDLPRADQQRFSERFSRHVDAIEIAFQGLDYDTVFEFFDGLVSVIFFYSGISDSQYSAIHKAVWRFLLWWMDLSLKRILEE